jgi:glycosyltransferase involved in cell wall biosynthesis
MLFGDSNILGDQVRGVRRFIKRLVLPWVLRQPAAILPCGRRGVEYFARYGVAKERMFLFPYEPDYGLIARLGDVVIEAMSRRFQLRPDRRRIVFSGRLIEVKRCDLVIDAFAAIAEARPDWDLLILGDGPLKALLQSRLPHHLTSRVTWTGFLPDQRDVSAMYRLSDILVLPSDWEPWALVINEAAAAGLAIVCTNVVGAAAELVRDGVNGRCFAPGALDQLIEALYEFTGEKKVVEAKAASKRVLADWRQAADPVRGLRDAVQFVTGRTRPAGGAR